ncbi:MAG TPA: nitroreductase/quinone reductase family protein [Nitrososphaeraceae archaeon]|nr:nitroreductase/quinone reductase family protein [Nitrososphaeraceae archaeon]
MSKSALKDILDRANELSLTVRGRKSGHDISRPVWFVHEDNTLYLLPVQGSDTNWYRNVLEDPTMKISVDGQELSGKAKIITDANKPKEIVDKFKLKYGNSDIKKYYTKFDVAVEFPLTL